MKAKAEGGDAKNPSHWHSHTEAPSPLPEGAKLWVEIETSAGKVVGSFDLKR